jgi:hypothetical protein
MEQLSVFRHTFNHFHLEIVPIVLENKRVGGSNMVDRAGL